MILVLYVPQPFSLLMEQATRGCAGKLEDTRRGTRQDFMVLMLVHHLTEIMLPDYQSHMAAIHVIIFGLLLLVEVKHYPTSRITVNALNLAAHLYLHMLVIITIVSQPLGIVVIMIHTTSTTLYGMEKDA